MPKLKCPNCEQEFTVSRDEHRVECPNCKNNYSNPAYVLTAEQQADVVTSTIQCPDCNNSMRVKSSMVMVKCPHCGQEHDNPTYKKPVRRTVANQYYDEYNRGLEPIGNSCFTGRVGSYFGRAIVNAIVALLILTLGGLPAIIGAVILTQSAGAAIAMFVLTAFTEFLCGCWCIAFLICRNRSWEVNNTVVDGYQLVFDGKTRQLWAKLLLWLICTIFSLGIYAWWVGVRYQEWIAEHTYIEGIDGESRFVGTVEHSLGLMYMNSVLTFVAFGLGIPWTICRNRRWSVNYLYINGYRMSFDGRGRQLFWRWLGWTVLTGITLGIFGLWKHIFILRWLTEHTHFE